MSTPTPARIYDGDMSVVTQDGPGWVTRPFMDKGDTQTWEWHAYYTQLAANFISFRNTQVFTPGNIPSIETMYSITTPLGTGYLVHEDEATEVNNTGLLRFKRTYAGVPYTRYEGCSVNYSFQLLATGSGTNEVEEWPMTLAGYRKYEYFQSSYPDPIQASAVNVIFGLVYKKGGYPVLNTPGVAYVASDSKISIYKGSFIERMTLYYIAPTFTPVLP